MRTIYGVKVKDVATVYHGDPWYTRRESAVAEMKRRAQILVSTFDATIELDSEYEIRLVYPNKLTATIQLEISRLSED